MSELQSKLAELSQKIKNLTQSDNKDMTIREMTESVMVLPDELKLQSDLCDKILNQKPFIEEFIEGRTEFLFIEDEEVPEGFFKEEGLNNLKELVWNTKKVNEEEFQGLQIESITLPYCEFLGGMALYNCSNLKKINLPLCNKFGSLAFANCDALETLSLPGCVETSKFDSIIMGLDNLKELSLPNCEKISMGSFLYIPNLTSLFLPVCKIIESQGFMAGQNQVLNEIILPECEYLGADALDGFKSIYKIFLPGNKLCEIESIDSIPEWTEWVTSNTQYVYRASCYVPKNLLEQYKNHSIWKDIAYNIYSIEEVQK